MLTACRSCARHVKTGEPACPFCGAAVEPANVPSIPRGRLTRALLLGGAVAMSGCYESHRRPIDGEVEADAGSVEDPTDPALLYGGPPDIDLV
jgi:hypothetical protein